MCTYAHMRVDEREGILSCYSPFSQVSEFEMGGVQESSVHVYLDGPETTKPLGQVSSMDFPISYDL